MGANHFNTICTMLGSQLIMTFFRAGSPQYSPQSSVGGLGRRQEDQQDDRGQDLGRRRGSRGILRQAYSHHH